MRARSGPHGPFFGCRAYPDCRGTRPINDSEPGLASGPSRPEGPGGVGDLLTALRRAGGHIGAALDLLARQRAEIENLIEKAAESDVPF
jgi:ssDNA-binding Zn-finger/Zn-ribbon topoisomerase 1